jgi:hypothetical protein
MSKKLITACLGVLALAAFMLPASASANPILTHPTGTTLNPATGSCTGVSGTVCITATSTAVVKLWPTSGDTGTPLTECTSAVLTGYLTSNGKANPIKGSIHTANFTGTGVNGECTSTFGGITVDTNVGNGVPWCIESIATTDEFQVRGNSCANEARSITFVLTSTTVGSCKYSRAPAVKGTFTTHSTGDAILTVNPTANASFTKEEGGIFCPSSGTLDMSMTLETDTTTSADPMYISS